MKYWKYWLSEVRRGTDYSTHRTNLKYATSVVHHRPTITKIKKNLRSAQRALQQTQQQAYHLRQVHLQERADMAATANNSKSATEIHRIKRAEEVKRVFNRLRNYRHHRGRQPLTTVITESETLTQQDDIVRAIIERNLQHFSQATGTPFTRENLTSLFGPDGTTSSSDDLITNNFDFTHMNLSETLSTVLRKLCTSPT